jgi:hypothetical protein
MRNTGQWETLVNGNTGQWETLVKREHWSMGNTGQWETLVNGKHWSKGNTYLGTITNTGQNAYNGWLQKC